MSEARAALIVGIDQYNQPSTLVGCEKDAQDVARLLSDNEDDTFNMQCTLLSTMNGHVTADKLWEQIERLFGSELSCAVFYFAGHSVLDDSASAGFLVTSDGTKRNPGIRLDDIIKLVNKPTSKVQSAVIIVDSCHSAALASENATDPSDRVSKLGDGVTILASSGREQASSGDESGGIFTQLMIECLKGSAADLLGHVTPAAVYAFIDRHFGATGQRPVYKANVSRFTSLRKCKQYIARETLKSLPVWFPDPFQDCDLSPAHEPNRDNVPQSIMDIPPDPKLVAIFEKLQACNRQGLVVPVDEKHMYYAAINSKSCRLTALGRHYHKLARNSLLV